MATTIRNIKRNKNQYHWREKTAIQMAPSDGLIRMCHVKYVKVSGPKIASPAAVEHLSTFLTINQPKKFMLHQV